jgi:hypothetical protein
MIPLLAHGGFYWNEMLLLERGLFLDWGRYRV